MQTDRISAPTVSVIVCAYTDARWTELIAAVESVQHQTMPPHEIIVVVDYNPDLLRRAQAQFAGVSVVANSGARGLSGARNSGVALAQGDVLAFLDDDAIAASDWLDVLCADYDDPTVIGVGGAIEPRWCDRRPGWFPAEFNWVVGCTYRGMPTARAAVRNLIGCNMSFRRSAIETIGGFRIGRVGALSIGQENDDTELCIRLSSALPDTQIIYQPAAVVQHNVTAQRATWRYFVRRCCSEGISKARLARLVGSQRGLSAERGYTLRTLPQGVRRGLSDVLKGDPSGLGRAVAIGVGFGSTALGYLIGRITRDRRTLAATAAARHDRAGSATEISLMEHSHP